MTEKLINSEIIKIERDKENRILLLFVENIDGKKQKLTPSYSHMGYYYIIENDI